MPRLVASIAALCVAAALSAASAAESASLVTPTGVIVRAHVEAGSRLVVEVVPARGANLNGRLGVAFAPRDAGTVWIGETPRVVTAEGDYFDGPVLHALSFDPGRLKETARLGVAFGACLPMSGLCVPAEAEIVLERRGGDVVVSTLASVEP